MTFIIEGEGALVNEAGEEQSLRSGDFALVDPDEKHQYRNKGDQPFKMICGVPKEFEWQEDIKFEMESEFRKGTILLKEGEIYKESYFIINGCIRQYCIMDGEENWSGSYRLVFLVLQHLLSCSISTILVS